MALGTGSALAHRAVDSVLGSRHPEPAQAQARDVWMLRQVRSMGQEFVLLKLADRFLDSLLSSRPSVQAWCFSANLCSFSVHKGKRVVFADPEPAAPPRSEYSAHSSYCALSPGFTRVFKLGFKPGESVKAQQ